VAEPPTCKTFGRLANGYEHPVEGCLAKRLQCLLRGERESTPEPTGPDSLFLAADCEQAPIERVREPADYLLNVFALCHQGEVLSVQVIVELGSVDELPGEKCFYALAPPLCGAAGPALCLASVFGADGGKQAIAERGLFAKQTTKSRIWNPSPFRLFGEEVPEEGVAGKVAT